MTRARDSRGNPAGAAMGRIKGGRLITEFLIDQGYAYVFGIRGHGNVGMLDEFYAARDRITLVSPRHEHTAGHRINGVRLD